MIHLDMINLLEWLDADQHILIKPDGDERTHEDLAKEWAETRNRASADNETPETPGGPWTSHGHDIRRRFSMNPDLDLAAILARANEATIAPWSEFDAQIQHTQIDGWNHPAERKEAQLQTQRDIDFVRHARTDVPALVAEVQRLRNQVAARNSGLAMAALFEQDRDYALARIRAVLDLHRDGGESQGYTKNGYEMIPNCCTECGSFNEYAVQYPCATVQAIEGETP